jgi:ADP-ribose pyrophosphatase YjhB (NUDIX family)
VRVEVRAVIMVDGRLVVTAETRRGEPHAALPGGGVKRWETCHEALVREVREETELVIEPGSLLYVAEVVSRYRLHDLDLFFAAEVTGGLDRGRFALVDPAGGGGVLPPILDEIGRDAAAGWSGHPRWLGNLWDSSR